MKTVATKLQELRDWRARTAGLSQAEEPYATPKWKARAVGLIDIQIKRLETFPPETPLLLDPAEALRSDLLDEEEKFVVLWQQRHQFDLSTYEKARLDLLLAADDKNLELLAQLWPVEVRAINRWRGEPGFASHLRGLPIDFDL